MILRGGAMAIEIGRRQFTAAIGSAAAWPLAVRAQQSERMRVVGVLTSQTEDDPEVQSWLAGFRQGLEKRGWSEGRNVRIVTRFAATKADLIPTMVKELVGLQPDVILGQTPPIIIALQHETRSIPIVFVAVSDPVGPGFVASMARPGGNITGLLTFEPGITGKWLAMLKEIAPRLERVALIANPKTTNYDYFVRAATVAVPSLAIELVPIRVEKADDIEREIVAFAGVPNGGLLLPPDSTNLSNRDLIIALAATHRLPAVYWLRFFVAAGGLMSYGTDEVEMFRQAASYVDRILRGDRASELPVQAPTKYETVLNLKTAKELGLEVPSSLLVRADEVIE